MSREGDCSCAASSKLTLRSITHAVMVMIVCLLKLRAVWESLYLLSAVACWLTITFSGGWVLSPASESGRVYGVKKGDTLTSIAQQHGSSVVVLKTVNDLKNDDIYPEQKIWVPRTYVIEKVRYSSSCCTLFYGSVVKLIGRTTVKLGTDFL